MAEPEPAGVAAEEPAVKYRYMWRQFALLAAIIAVNVLIPPEKRVAAWVVTMLLMTTFIVVAGRSVTDYWLGALIDDRKKISLSRLQMMLWTILVLSAFLCAAISNVDANAANPLAIALPNQLWILMGISTTSLVASPLIKGNRDRSAALTAKRGQAKEAIIKNKNLGDARWGDIFRGEEVSNQDTLDLGKIQMFFFTVVLVLTYAFALGDIMAQGAGPVTSFPEVHESMTALLGISHTGYLVNKAAPKPT